MKKLTLATILLCSAGFVFSQPAPTAPGSSTPDPYAALLKIKAENEAILKRQETTQKAMDVLLEEARQLRIFAKRT